MGEGKNRVNWRSLIAQGFILSITIYLPFFLENWNTERNEQEINENYKEFLKEDLYSDIANLDIMIIRNEIYLDSAFSVMRSGTDSVSLKKRAYGMLALGVPTEFTATTDVSIFIEQFRHFGSDTDLKLIRHLNRLEQAFELVDMVDTRRMDYIQTYYTPIFLENYSIKDPIIKPTDLEFFDSDTFLNTISMFYNLGLQVHGLYLNTKDVLVSVLQSMGEETDKLREEVEKDRQEMMKHFQPS